MNLSIHPVLASLSLEASRYSAQKPNSGSRSLYAGGRLGSKQVPPPNLSGTQYRSPVLTSSLIFRRLIDRFACARLSEPYLPQSYVATFPKRSLPWLFTNAALGGLKPAPVLRLQGARPHLLCSYAHFILKVRSWRTTLRLLQVRPVYRYHNIYSQLKYVTKLEIKNSCRANLTC